MFVCLLPFSLHQRIGLQSAGTKAAEPTCLKRGRVWISPDRSLFHSKPAAVCRALSWNLFALLLPSW